MERLTGRVPGGAEAALARPPSRGGMPPVPSARRTVVATGLPHGGMDWRGGWVEGVVVDAQGRAVHDALVVWAKPNGEVEIEPTGEDGEFLLMIGSDVLDPGMIFAQQSALGRSAEMPIASLGADGRLVLDRAAGIVRGQVVYPDGEPARFVLVDCRCGGAVSSDQPKWYESVPDGGVRTDREGRFEVLGLTPLLWTFEIREVDVEVTARSGQSIRLVVPRPFLSVRAVDPGGSAIENAWVEWSTWVGASAEQLRGGAAVEALREEAVEARAAGALNLGWLEIGDFVELYVSAPGFEMQRKSVFVGPRGWRTDFEVVLRPMGLGTGVQLRLAFPSFARPRPVLVEVMTLGAFERFVVLGGGEDTRDASWVVPPSGMVPLRPGRYRLFLRVPGAGQPFVPREHECVVVPGAFTELDVQLDLGARPSFDVLFPRGAGGSAGRRPAQLDVRCVGGDGWPLRWRQPAPVGGLTHRLVLVSAAVLEPGPHVLMPKAGQNELAQTVELVAGLNRFWIHLEPDGTVLGWGRH